MPIPKLLQNKIETYIKLFDRLKYVSILNRNAIDIIKTFDRETTLFYLDPPYPGADQKYSSKFNLEDFNKMTGLLKEIKAKFLLSCYLKDGMELDPNWTIRKKEVVCHAEKREKKTQKNRVLNYEL